MIKIVNSFTPAEKNIEPTLQVMLSQRKGSSSLRLAVQDEKGNTYEPVLAEIQRSHFDDKRDVEFHLRLWVKNENGSGHTMFTYKLPKIPSFD